MNLQHLGNTRSRRALDHLLQTPDTFVQAALPGMGNATAVVHAAPALGAAFTQYTATLGPGGRLADTDLSRFIYVLQGEVQVVQRRFVRTLVEGAYAYLPAGAAHAVQAAGQGGRIAVIEKPWVEHPSGARPSAVLGVEREVESVPLLGDAAIQVRALLGVDTLPDFAINTMEYQPGARLPMVEVHVMEHGLLMLEGEGIYRLGDAWYPVAAGDFIWMGAFCPQWFGALGPTPARYLIYKDWNRHPMDGAR